MQEARVSQAATKLAVRHYLRELWRQRKFSIPTMLLMSTGSVFTTFVPPLVVAAMINRFGQHSPTIHELPPYLALFAGAWLFGELLWRLSFLCLSKTEVRGMQNLYIRTLAELQKKDLHFFHNNFAGSLTKRALGYARSFEKFVDAIIFNIARNVFPLLFASIILWRFSPWIVLALFACLGLTLAILIPLIRRRKKLVDLREEASNHVAGHIADVIGNIDAVQAFAHEDTEQKNHEVNVKDFMRKTAHAWDFHTLRIDSVISPIYVMTNVLGLALAIVLGGGAITMGVIFLTFNYFANITMILWEFNRIYRDLENAVADAAQFTQLLLTPNQLKDVVSPQPFAVTKGQVELRQVDFNYQGDQQQPLFQDFNLQISAGEKVALVGRSGGGKTTVTKLLLRFVDLTGGELLIDGQNIATVSLRDLRSSIAYVPQEPAMFHRSIRENIRYGRLDASDADVEEAAKKAHAHEFIAQLASGYDTLVGERGVKLSGGQRQRIAIARAIIKDAPILVLDEATSALDSESEKLIQAALWELMKGRTAIVIAHRLSTIQKMDRIVVLDHGAIAEQGTHKQLLDHNGIYAKLWAHQSGGFINE